MRSVPLLRTSRCQGLERTPAEHRISRDERSRATRALTGNFSTRVYGCGPIQFSGRDNAFYERHLIFDNVVAPEAAGPRERFEAVARSVRDVLSQRWVQTEQTYDRENPKRIYYLSMEFLIGRSLANNITNLLLDPFVKANRRPARTSTGSASSSRNRMPAWATAGSAGWRPASSIRWPRCSSRPWATACATSTASSSSPSRTAGSTSSRTTGCAAPTRGRSRAPTRRWRSSSNCSFELRGGSSARRPRPAVQPDRHPVRPARRRLRRQDHQHAAALGRGRARLLRLPGIQQRRLRRRAGRDAGGRIAHPRALSRRLHQHGAGAALRAGVLSGRLLAGRSRPPLPPRQRRLERAARQGRHPAQRHASRRWPCPS